MATYKIQIPSYLKNTIGLESLFYDQENDAIDTLIKVFTQKNIDFKLKQTRDRKVFINTNKGELAAIVSSDSFLEVYDGNKSSASNRKLLGINDERTNPG